MTKTSSKNKKDFLWQMVHRKAFVSSLRGCIKDAVLWTNYPQPMNALVSPSGIGCTKDFSGFTLTCSPKGHGNTPVIVFTRSSNDAISSAESSCLTQMVKEHGRVADTWTSGNGDTWLWSHAVRLQNPAGQDLLRCLDDYTKGCPDHPEKGMLCQCGWYAKGLKKLIVPKKFKG